MRVVTRRTAGKACGNDAVQRRGDRVGAAERRVVPGGRPCLGLGWLGDRAQDGLDDAQLDRCDVGGGEPLGAQPQGGVHARVGEVVARVQLEDHARQLPVGAQAADDGVRVGAVAAERLQERSGPPARSAGR